jgi:hypothetical protein
MNENREKGIGDFLGSVLGSLTGATAPMLTGVLKSVRSPTAIGSVVKMIPDVLNAVSSIDIGKIIGTIVTAI